MIDIHCDFNSTDLRSTKKYSPCWCWATLTPPPNTIPHIPDLRELTINRYSWLELQADHPSARRLRYTATHASARRTLSFTLLSRFSDDSRERSSRTPGHLDGGLVGLLWLGESENDTDLGLFPARIKDDPDVRWLFSQAIRVFIFLVDYILNASLRAGVTLVLGLCFCLVNSFVRPTDVLNTFIDSFFCHPSLLQILLVPRLPRNVSRMLHIIAYTSDPFPNDSEHA